MSVKSGQSVTVDFTTADPTTGAAADADALPTATLVVNGTDNAATVTVTNKATGVYKAAVTLPALSAGDVVSIRVAATVATVAGVGVVWTDVADTKRVSDLRDEPMRGTDGALLAADYIAPDNASVGAIKAKTDNLPADTAGAIAALPTDADVQVAAQAAILAEDVATETTLGAVKAKTDNLPLSPAATGDAMALTAAERTSVASAVWAATTRTLTDGTGSIQLTFRMLLDSDNDGVPDDPPVGVPDVRCLLFTDAAGTQPVGAVKLTDTQGYARWYGLAAGTYYMRREKAGMLFDDDPLAVEVVEPV